MKEYTTNKSYFKEELVKSSKTVEYIYQNAEFNVKAAYEDDKFYGYEVTPKKQGTYCRKCNKFIRRIKGTRVSYPTVGIINDKPVILKLVRKLYKCDACNCQTIHQVKEIINHAQKSEPLKAQVIKEIVSKNQTYTQTARRYKMSVSSVIRYFDKTSYMQRETSKITHISIDETKLIPKAGKYQFIVTNALNGEIIAVLANRYANTVESFLKLNFPKLEVVTQDFWETYRRASLSLKSQPKIVVDRFHFVRFAMWAYNRARIEIQKQSNLRLMKTWKLQNKSRKALCKLSKRKLDKIIEQNRQLKLSYRAKEFFLHLSRLRNIDEFRNGMKKWRAFVLKHKLHHFYSIFTTLDNWHTEIEHMVTCPFSNGGAERANRSIKQAKNQAFGFKNLTRTEKLMIMRTACAY